MKVITWEQFITNNISGEWGKKISMTIGIFDGVHLGHQVLIKNIVSHNKDYIPVVVTFRENHKTKRTNCIKEIQSFKERLKLFEELGVKETIVINFTEEFKQKPGNDFLEILIKHGNIGYFAVGCNFRCGCKLDTDAKKIEKFFISRGIPVGIVPEFIEGSLPVSSSRIRTAIAEGNVKLAEKMLGRKL